VKKHSLFYQNEEETKQTEFQKTRYITVTRVAIRITSIIRKIFPSKRKVLSAICGSDLPEWSYVITGSGGWLPVSIMVNTGIWKGEWEKNNGILTELTIDNEVESWKLKVESWKLRIENWEWKMKMENGEKKSQEPGLGTMEMISGK
jgi:hypothetical protein